LPKVVGVRFRKAGKIYYFDPGSLALKTEQDVIVETSRGLEFGKVIQGIKEVHTSEIVSSLKLVKRVATAEDYKQLAENRRKEKEALKICQEKIKKHQLEMKLIDVEYTFDHNKIIFYFTADGRIDFRELVRDLAFVFRTRIELRQIGVRDEAKILGGMGACGRDLCCATFLGDFEPVSIRMAKDQNLSLNPAKISGICGRLMCCLRYEAEHYENARGDFPALGEEVLTLHGCGKVVSQNIVKKSVLVQLKETSMLKEFPLEEVDYENQEENKKGKK
jgi:cell fate regulator YaaT (PSP1 superfamily)